MLTQSVAVGLGILRRESRELSLALWPMRRLYEISSTWNFPKVDIVWRPHRSCKTLRYGVLSPSRLTPATVNNCAEATCYDNATVSHHHHHHSHISIHVVVLFDINANILRRPTYPCLMNYQAITSYANRTVWKQTSSTPPLNTVVGNSYRRRAQ